MIENVKLGLQQFGYFFLLNVWIEKLSDLKSICIDVF